VKIKTRTLKPTTTFEHLCCHVTARGNHFLLLGVYRPGSFAATAAFFDELAVVLEQLCTYRCPIVVTGDFNVHVDVHDDVNATRLRALLQSFDCVQHVDQPTHRDGHTLDLVVTSSDTKLSHLHVGDLLSDHALVTFSLGMKRPRAVRQRTTIRPWKKFCRSAFEADLAASRLCTDMSVLQDLSADDLAEMYDTTMQSLLDKHCPAIQIQRKSAPMTPWFDADCRASRRNSRRLERRKTRTGDAADRLAWIRQLKAMHTLYEEKEQHYWRGKIEEDKGNSKKLWQTMSGIMGEKPTGQCENGDCTADDFAKFFADKVDSIRTEAASTPPHHSTDTASHVISDWKPVSALEVEKLIGSSRNKTCQLDPAPTWLIKDHRSLLSPFIALLVNRSLATGCFPKKYKHAIVFPLLKKDNLDASQLKNFRPVSNLPYLSKLLERATKTRLQEFLDEHDLMPAHQSAYRKFHSTETALLRLYNDLLVASDQGQVSGLCLLDLTAAFDTVDHELLLERLDHSFGVRGLAKEWFTSYLTGRSYSVIYGGKSSAIVQVTCSVPQGSVLGPLLFILYTADLAELAAKFGVSLHAFADDNQLHVHCDVSDVMSSVDALEQCVAAISRWMTANRLKLNASKTELLWAGTRHTVMSLLRDHDLTLTLGTDTAAIADAVRVLGVVFTPDLALDKHATAVSAKCFYQLRQLRRVRRSLDRDSAAILVHAFVTSRVDYGNSLLANAPRSWTDKMQRVMNAAARVISGTRKFDRGLSEFIRDDLHWLNVPQRVTFKLCLLVYKCMHGLAPQYLAELCVPVADVTGRRQLRSAARGLLDFPRYCLKNYGRRAFSYAGPHAWNSLPDTLRQSPNIDCFKRSLKTFLFTQMLYPAH